MSTEEKLMNTICMDSAVCKKGIVSNKQSRKRVGTLVSGLLALAVSAALPSQVLAQDDGKFKLSLIHI